MAPTVTGSCQLRSITDVPISRIPSKTSATFAVADRRRLAAVLGDFDLGAEGNRQRLIRVCIIDHHDFVRRGLAALIDTEPDMTCCGELDGESSVRDALRRLKPDVVLVDVSRRSGRGLQLIQEVRAIDPQIRVVALSMDRSPAHRSRMIDAGAETCVAKLDLARRVLQAIRRAHGSRAYGNGARFGRSEGSIDVPSTRHRTQLGETEWQIVELIGRGVPARAIAVRLGLSVQAVEAHRSRIRDKLKVLTGPELVEFCVGWVQRRRGDACSGGSR